MVETPPNRDEFLDLGTHCSDKFCNQLDFLPFKCPSCQLPFCSDHWRPPSGHKCSKYDPNLADNRIPSCPLCSKPISYPVGEDPNIAMDAHLSTTCPSLHPPASANKSTSAKAASTGGMKTCNFARCTTKLIVPIKCDKCRKDFCPKHRYANDHSCGGIASTSTSSATKTKALQPSGLAALRRAQEMVRSKPTSSKPIQTITIDDSDDEVQIVKPKSATNANKASNTKQQIMALSHIPNKQDKRAASERASARKALEARAKKGLLTEKEKLDFATMKAMEANGGRGGKDGCEVS